MGHHAHVSFNIYLYVHMHARMHAMVFLPRLENDFCSLLPPCGSQKAS